MSDGSPVRPPADAAVRPRWPYAGPGQRVLLLGAAMITFGSFLPWVATPVGNLSGMAGPGLWTFSFGVIGIGGALLRRRSLALVHALAAGVCGVALPAWQVVRLVEVSTSTGAWGAAVPSTGLLLVLGGGALALRATWRLHTGT